MRFVMANRLLDHAGGTEVHLLTLAEQLQRLGHEVFLYSPQLGPFTDHVRRRGIDVSDELRELPEECDVVLSQDALVVYDLAERFGSAVHVFRVCGDTFDFQLPPQLDGIVDLIVVLSGRYERVVRACAVKAPVLRLRVPIDTNVLSPVTPIRDRPKRAVLLGNYPERAELVNEAWTPQGIEVTRIGSTDQRYDLATALADADIVVAKSRAALDAMGCGRAVYVFDVFGGDGWVTPGNYAALEADNFAGQATDRVIGVAELERDLANYESQMGLANRDLIAQHHGARDHAVEFLTGVQALTRQERPAAPFRELARLTAMQWSWERQFRELERERVGLIERVRHAELRASEAEAAREGEAARTREVADHAAGLEFQLQAMRATRVWRLATGYWRWRDGLFK